LHSSLDPRIKLIKQKEKEAREAKKTTGVAGGAGKKTKAQEEEEKKRAAEENLRKEEEEKVRFLLFHFPHTFVASLFAFPFFFITRVLCSASRTNN
jgi:hypothetical protein